MSAEDCSGESGLCLELAMSNCSQVGRDKGSGRQKEKQEMHRVRTEESEDIKCLLRFSNETQWNYQEPSHGVTV